VTPEIENIPCPKCGAPIIRPVGASTTHSCGVPVPASFFSGQVLRICAIRAKSV